MRLNFQDAVYNGPVMHSSQLTELFDLPLSLQTFQSQFGDYVRDQDVSETAKKYPQLTAHVPERVGKVYQSLVYSNTKSFINQCFPICQSLLTTKQWQTLSLSFFQNGDMHSPYFTEINQQFVDYVAGLSNQERVQLGIPDYFAELAHYEWAELMIDVAPDEDALEVYAKARLNPTIEILHYQWPVNFISAQNIPKETKETFIVVYRTQEFNVKFMDLNAMTYALVAFMYQETQKSTIYESKTILIESFFNTMNIEVQPNMIAFGEQVIEKLSQQHIIFEEQ